VFRWFLGGWIAHVPDVMVFYAPTVNSYKRYVDASWAPTRLAWSYDNRTAGFRIVGQGPSLRIECRIPGADCNPYLAYAAVLAAGLDGVRIKTVPPAVFLGDEYQAKELPRVPSTLREAQRIFAKSDFAKQAFGPDVHEHYAHFFDEEATAYENAVTDWERWRYFERSNRPVVLSSTPARRHENLGGFAADARNGKLGRNMGRLDGKVALITGAGSGRPQLAAVRGGVPPSSPSTSTSGGARHRPRRGAAGGGRQPSRQTSPSQTTAPHGGLGRRAFARLTCSSTTPGSCTGATTMP
jgi:hypothetical protein